MSNKVKISFTVDAREIDKKRHIVEIRNYRQENLKKTWRGKIPGVEVIRAGAFGDCQNTREGLFLSTSEFDKGKLFLMSEDEGASYKEQIKTFVDRTRAYVNHLNQKAE